MEEPSREGSISLYVQYADDDYNNDDFYQYCYYYHPFWVWAGISGKHWYILLPPYLCQFLVLLEIKTTGAATQIGGSYSPCLTTKDCTRISSSRDCELSNWTCPATIDFTHELYQVEQQTERVCL